MKTLKYLSILTIFLSQISNAQEVLIENSNAHTPQLEEELKQLAVDIDLYFEQMITLKSTLAIRGLKISSEHLKSDPVLLEAAESLELSRLQIIDSIKNYKVQIEIFSNNTASLASYEKLKFLYDIVLIKSFLPRYDVAKVNVFTRVFSSYQPQYVDELIPRSEALTLFYAEFDLNESTKDALNSNFRVEEIVKTHNSITAKINQLRASNLFQTYPKTVKLQNGLQEATIYQSLIRGEVFPSTAVTSTLTATKTSEDHFKIGLACAGLFSL